MNILGVIENMSGFVCPNCKCESQIFPANTGGADKMCSEYNLKLLGKIPLDPNVLITCESGKGLEFEAENNPKLKESPSVK